MMNIANMGAGLSLTIRQRTFINKTGIPSYSLLILGIIFVLAAAVVGPFSLDIDAFAPVMSTFGSILILGMIVRWLGSSEIGGCIEIWGFLLCLMIVTPLCAVISASMALPLMDEALARTDALLFFGFDRRQLMAVVKDWDIFMQTVGLIYHSLLPQPYLIVLLLCFTKQEKRAWTFLLAWTLTLGISVVISPFFPAYGTPPYSYKFIEVLNGARDGSLRYLDSSALTGIITFPSFHAAGAVVLGWAASQLRFIGPIFVILNVLVFGSALIAGGHYLIDLGPVDKLDSQARQNLIQDSFCGVYLGAFADGGCRVGVL